MLLFRCTCSVCSKPWSFQVVAVFLWLRLVTYFENFSWLHPKHHVSGSSSVVYKDDLTDCVQDYSSVCPLYLLADISAPARPSVLLFYWRVIVSAIWNISGIFAEHQSLWEPKVMWWMCGRCWSTLWLVCDGKPLHNETAVPRISLHAKLAVCCQGQLPELHWCGPKCDQLPHTPAASQQWQGIAMMQK